MDRTHEPCSRREFVGKTLSGAAGALAAFPIASLPTSALLAGEPGAEAPKAGADPTARRSAVDLVKLGETKVQVTRLALGTGSNGGKVQRDMGQEAFTRMVRHAWDRGVRFIDTADDYKTHEMVGRAIQGLPRDRLVIQTKLQWRRNPDVAHELDRFRKELGTDTIDIVLLHCCDQPGWPESLERLRDGLSAAKEKGIIRAHGVSAHGLPGLREVARCPWVQVALLRINHRGKHMDGARGAWDEPADVEEALAHIEKVHRAKKGVIGMKIVGNGDFTSAEDREKSVAFVMRKPFIDAVDIGFKSIQEVDETLERMDRALNA